MIQFLVLYVNNIVTTIVRLFRAYPFLVENVVYFANLFEILNWGFQKLEKSYKQVRRKDR